MLVRQRHPIYTLDRMFDRVFDNSFDTAFEQLTNSLLSRRHVGPIVDGTWKDDEYILTVDLPGVPAEAVSVEVAGNVLKLGVTTDQLEWTRSLTLGSRLDPEKVTAHHVDGRLTVRVGSVDSPATRRIEIDTMPAPAAIEAASTDTADDTSDEAAAQSTETKSAD